MNLKSILFRNIGPYGNKLNEIYLSEKGGLWIITGKNGGGKSTLLNLPKALFYGKVDKLKKEQIANRFNKHGFISGTVQLSPTDTCVIERSFSPSNLIVYKNGEDIGKAGLSDYQQFIDNEITQMPYNIFSNVVSLSVNDFKSFISMTPNDKRHIIDKIFSMEIINKMYEYVKKDIRDIKYSIDMFNKEIQVLVNNTERAKIELSTLKDKQKENNNEKLKNIIEQLKTLKPKLDKAKEKYKECVTKKNSLVDAYKNSVKNVSNIEREISSISKKINLYNNDKCPTCEASFKDDAHEFIKNELQNKLSEKRKLLNELNAAQEVYKNSIKTLDNGINTLLNFINSSNSNISTLKYQYEEIKKISSISDFSGMQNIINENAERITEIENDKNKKDIDVKYLSILETMYSGDGIKRKIMESYLPHLNNEVENTLLELNFPYTLQFDNNFEPIIKHLGLDISSDTLSTGEKKRADLAVLISIIRMMKIKFPRLNMFMLDEVLSSIDSDGILDIISYLHKTSKDMGINIFVINHTVLPLEYFDRKISISKIDNYSDLTIEEII